MTSIDSGAVTHEPIGDWLVVPLPTTSHLWRWGRIHQVISENGRTYYRVPWVGDVHGSVVLPPPEARVDSSADWPSPAGDAIGVWPT